MKKFVSDGTVKSFELWNPADLGLPGRVRGGRAGLRQDHRQRRARPSPPGKLGSFTVGADNTVLLGPPFVFDSSNIGKFNF